MAVDDQDLQLSTDGTWEPYLVFANDDDSFDVEEGLNAQGWEPFLCLGSGETVGVEISLYQRRTRAGHPEYLLSVWGAQNGSPFLKVDTLPAAMQLLAQWAPVVQAASISSVVSDLKEPVIEHEGLVESVAARAAWGAQERMPKLKHIRDQWDRDDREKRRAARKS
ncbi:hypothetical protein [Amycolatopsis sp. NPDC051903]|uniref:hypothetical protein n=1 Tax=Amycolatopsis sp. NPDC051903 TaxID=3363936 RepID=UPI0037A445B7